MKGLWLGTVVLCGLACASGSSFAGELAGRLERVDLESVTLRAVDDKTVVVRVERDHRVQVAPFLGRWVTVDVKDDQGVFRALGFRCSRGK